ncbi:MAG: DUF1749 domain-containing protein [Candidatus Diapherotrites archaeon]|nr:DUF1749 domain-containing protein [Candidatus Diapherotrites archaeon]
MRKIHYYFKGELFNFFAKDGLDLEGFLFHPKKPTKTAWIHVHGMTDFFSGERFLDRVRNVALKNNMAFLTFDNRGMGNISVFKKVEKNRTRYVHMGTSLEKFEHCLYDIGAAIKTLKEEGFENFVLSGHSTGCQKTAYYLSKYKKSQVDALILLSPVDDLTFDKMVLGRKFKPALKLAEKLVNSGRGHEIMPYKYSSEYWSAQRFYNLYKEGSIEGNLFNYTKPLNVLKKINQPILSILASGEEYIVEPAIDMIKKIDDVTLNPLSKGIAIDGGDHCFVGIEKEMESVLNNWIKKLKKEKAL